jgi:hypothetical protein
MHNDASREMASSLIKEAKSKIEASVEAQMPSNI